MTGYESKKAAAIAKTIDEVNWADHEPDGLAQPAQEPSSVTYKEVQDSMNALEKGSLYQQVIAEELGERKLYTAPPQRPWVGLTEEDLKLLSAEWRIVYGAWMDDFARDIETKLKEKNNAA